MMCVDPGDLWRHVRPYAQHAPALLVRELERLQVEVVTRSGQQRLEKVDEWGNDKLVAPACGTGRADRV